MWCTAGRLAALLARQQARQPPTLPLQNAIPALQHACTTIPTHVQHRGYAKKNQADHDSEGGEFFLEQLKPNTTPRPTYTEEELKERQARAKAYSRNMMHYDIKLKVNLKRKRELMVAAFNALPEELKRAAAEPDTSLFPTERGLFTDTPPIKWYRQWKQRQAAKQR